MRATDRVADGGAREGEVARIGGDEFTVLLSSVQRAEDARDVAHRVGDFVFTYHGIDLNNADPGLWVIVVHPDPTIARARQLAGPGVGRPTRMHVGRADGTMKSFPIQDMTIELAAQNQLRAAAGLGPLPPPETVTHESPGIVVGD